MEFAPLPFDVVEAAIATGRLLQRHAERALEYQGLTWEQLLALVAIHDAGGSIHAGAIARRIGVTRQAASRYLHRFDGRGLVRWQNQPWVRGVQLTEEGTRVLREAIDELTDIFAAVGRVSLDERRRIVTARLAVRRELHRPPHRRSWLERYVQPQLWDDDLD